MNAKDFAKGVSHRLHRLIGDDLVSQDIEQCGAELDRSLNCTEIRMALIRTVFSIGTEVDLPNLLVKTLRLSTRRVARLFCELAWIKGGKRRDPKERAVIPPMQVVEAFNIFLDCLCAPKAVAEPKLRVLQVPVDRSDEELFIGWGRNMFMPENVIHLAGVLRSVPDRDRRAAMLVEIAKCVLDGNVASVGEFANAVTFTLHDPPSDKLN
ncbi:MAG: hypothetical protein WA001_01415 [Patescibacteria group bacterium]